MRIKKLYAVPNWRNDKRDEQASKQKFNYYSWKLTLYKYNIQYNRKELIIDKISSDKM